jgi:hypothetical protein
MRSEPGAAPEEAAWVGTWLILHDGEYLAGH